MPNPRSGLASVMNNGILPNHSSAVEEKFHRANSSSSWTRPVSLPIPGVRTRRLRILVPNVGSFQQLRGTRVRRSRGPLLVCFACMALFLTVMMFSKNQRHHEWPENWPPTTSESSTLVFRREDLQRIWKWEIASGHFPSSQTIPKQVGLKTAPLNPALPHQGRTSKLSRNRSSSSSEDQETETYGVGPKRVYLDNQSVYPNVAYPPRPVPGSVADMDIIMKHCNFSAGRYVRDCLEVLRVGGGLDNGRRTRRGNTDDWKYIYQELNSTEPEYEMNPDTKPANTPRPAAGADTKPDPDAGLVKKRGAEWEAQVVLPSPLKYRPSAALKTPCDPDNPRVYHMFWTGPFTDKPYLALLSFLFTQNTGIHLKEWPEDSPVCRPQFWMWINPGPAASVPNPSARRDMFAQLKASPWASPFLHPRFSDVIKFKLWNTTEQLDGIPEIKDEWRSFKTLFNSGGHVISVPAEKKEATSASASGNETATTTQKAEEEDMLKRTGSKSSSSYDRLSVILSDMARFILCHRFGGIYLDADTIFLRDWEELWGWKGAFAYRWSRLEKYNTAVLRMHKGSALGTFLFRTALRNGLDFHPMTVSLYTADAFIEPLLLRLPDALFDAAWLNTENYQRDRPPQPYFTEFADFFDTPAQNSAAPQALGFDGFFKGSYSYHFHNFWWKPFDPTRNWPDLGHRFKAGEEQARAALKAAEESKEPSPITATGAGEKTDSVENDKRDLDWSAVLKRTFEAYIRGERPNMYGEWIQW
ncbi:putative glycosyltransferase sugar-binding region containing DXD motif [Lyophyllum shimeji]|uniref:Glycosyltransferase sugar-binding region containing DXD motif n=1 Tax=Lyophyllum shimeji TaxID=47721 RepID=A0A9P3PQB9_LYOSH|nr:putative glycosyltransferase sugar-binding region containing DXD motif [Lyophyllum shimeji]